MAYICAQIDTQNPNQCAVWVLHTDTLSQLAITKQQGSDMVTALLLVFIGAYAYRQIMNIILNRKY